jgi:hypothetical protein
MRYARAVFAQVSLVLGAGLILHPVIMSGANTLIYGLMAVAGLALVGMMLFPSMLLLAVASVSAAVEYGAAVMFQPGDLDALAPLYALVWFLYAESLELNLMLASGTEVERTVVIRRATVALIDAAAGGLVATVAFAAGAAITGTELLLVLAAVCAAVALVVPLRLLETSLPDDDPFT